MIVCPLSGEQVVALPSVSDVCWSCLSLVVPVGADTGAKPPATLVGVGLERRLPSSVMSSSLGVTVPFRTLLLYLAWLQQSGTCPPLLQMASSPGVRVKWRVECTSEMTAKLCQLLSADEEVSQEAGLIGIDRWMLRRSYCVGG